MKPAAAGHRQFAEGDQNMDASGRKMDEAVLPASAVPDFTSIAHEGTRTILAAQSALLAGVDMAMTAWLSRHQAIVSETGRLFGSLAARRDAGEMWDVQRVWMKGIGRCFGADLSDRVAVPPVEEGGRETRDEAGGRDAGRRVLSGRAHAPLPAA